MNYFMPMSGSFTCKNSSHYLCSYLHRAQNKYPDSPLPCNTIFIPSTCHPTFNMNSTLFTPCLIACFRLDTSLGTTLRRRTYRFMDPESQYLEQKLILRGYRLRIVFLHGGINSVRQGSMVNISNCRARAFSEVNEVGRILQTVKLSRSFIEVMQES